MSDVIQLLSDRDMSPWEDVVGFLPVNVTREASAANKADLHLSSPGRRAVIEVKLGHLMSSEQEKAYEALTPRHDLYLAALAADRHRIKREASPWTFLSFADLFRRWAGSKDTFARLLALETATTIDTWDRLISGLFEAGDGDTRPTLRDLDQKFLARVVTRRVAEDLQARGWRTSAAVTAGGGLPVVRGRTPIRGETEDRSFMAEVRWWETRPGAELRFGVDFEPRSGEKENESVRRAAFDLATSMAVSLEYVSLRDYIAGQDPELALLLSRTRASRPQARGDWESVIVHGFAGAPLEDGRKNNRNRTRPIFYGDGTLRFQAIVEIDFDKASARDLTDLLDYTLGYLAARQPV